MEKNENGPLNLYKKTILWNKLIETINELKRQGQITPNLEKKIILKFDEIMCDEILKISKNKNIIRGKVKSFRNCDDIWIFYCKDIIIKLDNYKKILNIPKLKIIALDEKLKKKGKSDNRLNAVGEGE